MADRLLRASVTIGLDSNLPEDSIVNTFYFDQDDNGVLPSPEESYDTVFNKLAAFYGGFDDLLFPVTVGTATVRIYDMRDPEPRLLRFQDTFEPGNNGTSPLPNQVAVCLSFAAEPVAGVNPQRRRGRVFLGPCGVNASSTVDSNSTVSAAVRTAIANAASALATPTDVPGDPVSSLSWAIYSPTTDAEGANIDDSMHDVQSGWIDNRFDIQRRRAIAPTARTTWS